MISVCMATYNGGKYLREQMAIYAKKRVMELFVLDKIKDKLKQLYQ